MNVAPNVGALDESLIFRIATPTQGAANAVATKQLGAVDGATDATLFTRGTISGRGKLTLIALKDADRELLKAAANGEEMTLTADFLLGNTATVIRSVTVGVPGGPAAGGAGLKHATEPIVIDSSEFEVGRVTLTATMPALVSVSEIAIVWTPDN